MADVLCCYCTRHRLDLYNNHLTTKERLIVCLIFGTPFVLLFSNKKENKMEVLISQYNSLKDLAKSFMKAGNISEYFRIISRANELQLRIIELGLRNK